MNELAEDSRALLESALAHHQAGRLEEAEALYVEVLVKEPKQPDAMNLLGVLAAQTGRQEEALKLVRASIVAQPQNHHFRFNHAHILELAGDPNAARAYRETLTINPYHVPALINLGHLHRRAERISEAITCFNRAISSEPGAAPAHEGLALSLQAQGDLEAARRSFEKALALDADNPDTLANLARLRLEAGETEAALEPLRRAAALQPGRADLHQALGDVLLRGGQPAEAKTALETALAQEPEQAGALALLGLARQALGEAADGRVPSPESLRERRLTRAPEFDSLAAFDAALAALIRARLEPLPDSRPEGALAYRTPELAGLEEPALEILTDTIRAESEAMRPEAAGWRLILRGELLARGASRRSQQNAAARLSGHYVVAAPETGGELELNRPPARYAIEGLPSRSLRPVEGQLLLFPAALWQATAPVPGDVPLITLTFHLVPA